MSTNDYQFPGNIILSGDSTEITTQNSTLTLTSGNQNVVVPAGTTFTYSGMPIPNVGGINTVIYQPGGTMDTFPQFNSFATLASYIEGAIYQDFIIYVDGSLSTDNVAIVPAGTYRLCRAITFQGISTSSELYGYPSISFSADVVFTGVYQLTVIGIYIYSYNAGVPNITLSDNWFYLNIHDGGIISGTGSQPFIAAYGVTTGSEIYINEYAYAILYSNNGNPVLTADSLSYIILQLFDESGLYGSAVPSGSFPSLYVYYVDSAYVDTSYGSANLYPYSQANQVAYSASTPSDWTNNYGQSSAPTNVNSALDVVASKNWTGSYASTVVSGVVTATTISVQGTPYVLNNVFTAGTLSNFTVSTSGLITYTGSSTVVVSCVASASLTSAGQNVTLSLLQAGSTVIGIGCAYLTSGQYSSISVSGIATLNTGGTLQLYVTNLSGTAAIASNYINFIVTII
jgi:hypothetical protein